MAKATGKLGVRPCGGCKKRQKWLNRVFPYKGENMPENECAYRGEAKGDHHKCRRLGECSDEPGKGRPCCKDCQERLTQADPDFPKRWQDPLLILDRQRSPTTALRGLLAGRSAFLLCGGPSANDLPLEDLARRGCWTLAVNNAAGHPRVRPQAFVCSDPPSKFSHSIWLDPAVMKFVPTPKMHGRRGNLRKKVGGEFSPLGMSVLECPNVWGFQRASWLTPDDQFFLTEAACWGNHQAGAEMTGQPKTVCTMMLALRILYHLGARRIYLLGVDFHMTPEYGYSFGQDRDEAACKSNNAQFSVVASWLDSMVKAGTFARFGLEVMNCFERSGLRAFPYAPFDAAIIESCGIVESVPDLGLWYLK